MQSWASGSADFFRGEGIIFQGPGGWGQKHTICLKNTKKDTIFLEKSRKTYYFGRPGGGGGQGHRLARPCGRPCVYLSA